MHRFNAAFKFWEQIAGNESRLRPGVDSHGGFGDDAQRPLTANAEVIYIDAVGGLRHGARRQHAIGGHHAQSDHHILDFAVLVALHSCRPRGNPTSQGGVQKRVGEMAKRYPICAQLLFEIGAEDSGLDSRCTGLCIYGEHSPQAAHIQRNRHAPGLHSFQAAGNIRSAAEGDDHDVVIGCGSKGQQYVTLTFGIDDQIGSTGSEAAAQAEQIAEAFAIGVKHSLLAMV